MSMTIAGIRKKYGFMADILRYYERIGLIPKVDRDVADVRNYAESDCGWRLRMDRIRQMYAQCERLGVNAH
jgi:DNA-binding transcriptional MerR regulator